MAITTVERTNILKLVVAMFNAPAGATYLNEIVSTYEAGGKSLSALAVALSNTGAYKALNPSFQSPQEFAAKFLTPYGLQGNAVAIDFIVSKFNAGVNKGQIALDAATAINNFTGTDAGILAAQAIQNNKTSVAEYYSVTKGVAQTDLAVLQAAFGGVTAAPASVVAANAAIDASAASLTTFTLTTGLDSLFGSSGNDVFTANVVQNNQGAQTNQLATGDKIVGGLGLLDTLNAVVQMASALNNSPASAIAPITTGVEQTFYTALTVNNPTLLNAAEVVNINAKSQTGLTKVGSVQSDASLFIQNLTTLTDTGVYSERRNTDSITVRMDHSGNDRAADIESNLTVLFDNDYLVSGVQRSTAINYFLLDREASLLTPARPLAKIDAIGVNFVVNGVSIQLTIPAAAQAAVQALGTFAAYSNALQAELAARQATGTEPALANLSFALSPLFRTQGKDGTVFLVPSQAITLTSSAGDRLTSIGFVTKQEVGVTYDVFSEIDVGSASLINNPIISNIELQKVGRGAEGGSLVVGGMSTDLANNFKYSNVALKEGVDRFDIIVSGDTTQMSSLSSLASTNNTLKTVNVTYVTGSLADLNIGNKNTAGVIGDVNGANITVDGIANVSSTFNLGLKDVKNFTVANNNSDNSNPLAVQTNDVTLNAYLSDQVVAKYMNRADNIANAATDNALFVYTTGAGNDVLNLNISKSNLAASGTATREDFSLRIDAGEGNNTVVTQIGDGVGTASTAWYINQTIQKNLSITTGAGNDVVRVNGAGSWDIKTGGGNDAIYSDNSGRQVIATATTVLGNLPNNPVESNAVWVFNSVNQAQGGYQNLFNLTSAAVVTSATKIGNLDLTVSYRGINVTVSVGETKSAAGGAVDDLTINQAIKAAINGNVYLKNLLSAQDGTGRTLVVTSLTDGVFNDADLSISLSNLTAITAPQTSNQVVFLSAAQLTALGFTGTGAFAVNGRFDSAIAEDAFTPTIETALVTFQPFAVAGTQSIGGMTLTATGAFTAAQVAQVAGGGAPIAGLTITQQPTLFTVAPAVGATNVFTSTSGGGNVANIAGAAATGAGNTAPTAVTTDGAQNSIVGAISGQANANVIDAGLGLDTVVLSTAGVLQAKEVVTVANVVADADVVFNAGAGSTIFVDVLDTVITSSGVVSVGGVGQVSVITGGINGSAGNDNINASSASSGQTINGNAGNDIIVGSAFADIITGGDGADTISLGFGNDRLVFNSLIGADTISDFGTSTAAVAGNIDQVAISKAVFTALAAAAGGPLAATDFTSNATGLAGLATDRLVYNTVTGALNYDADGTGTVAAVLVGTFTNATGANSLVIGDFTVIA